MKKLALIGQNISYSLSPLVHGEIFKELKLNGSYSIIDLMPDELRIDNDKLMSLDGFNVTQPFKNDIVPLLKQNNSLYQAVNTVVNRGGELYGYNTDALGFEAVIKTQLNDLSGLTVLIYGAGGMGAVASKVLKDLGANVFVCNRTKERAEIVAQKYGVTAIEKGDNRSFDLIVNCSSRGLYDNSGFDFLEADYKSLRLAFDTIYFDTAFLREAKGLNKNVKTENGLKMLIWQAVFADELFFDLTIENKADLVDKICTKIKQKIAKK